MKNISSDQIQVQVLYRGRVQGVGFRFFVERIARSLGLTGWVQNCPDGTVKAVFQGPKTVVDAAIEQTRKGPSLGYVEAIDLEKNVPDVTLGSFQIRM